MADSVQFLRDVFPESCKDWNVTVKHVDYERGFLEAVTSDGLVLHVHAADLGSVITVTIWLAGTDVIRTMTLNPVHASSKEFTQTHLLEWVIHGGQYGAAAKPHLQGLAPNMLSYIDRFLDDRSSANFRSVSRALRGNVLPRIGPSTSAANRAINTSNMNRLVWRRLEII